MGSNRTEFLAPLEDDSCILVGMGRFSLSLPLELQQDDDLKTIFPLLLVRKTLFVVLYVLAIAISLVFANSASVVAQV